MREITFTWNGQTLRLTPTMAILQTLANEVRRTTEGSETTVSLAFKCVNGGLEPMFMLIPLRAFLTEALGGKDVPTDEEIFAHSCESTLDVLSFRMAYVQAILPSVSLGKGLAAPSPVAGVGGQTRKERRAQKSTSKRSTSPPG